MTFGLMDFTEGRLCENKNPTLNGIIKFLKTFKTFKCSLFQHFPVIRMGNLN